MHCAYFDLGLISSVLAEYLSIHEKYLPEHFRHLESHKGLVTYVSSEEAHIIPDLGKATTVTGTYDELVSGFREIKSKRYSRLTVQSVQEHGDTQERWAKVFDDVCEFPVNTIAGTTA